LYLAVCFRTFSSSNENGFVAAATAGVSFRWHRSARRIVPRLPEHRRPKSKVVHCDNCRTFILEFAMNNVVERILNAYQTTLLLDAERVADSRKKISRYIESLASAG
jgi:hypothetical protein